ncbi:hypothetical protein MRS44_010593 [Fusarium solani]|uniref:Uncharacterized protein n=1 Tax=Fusarium solani TaxID=169388 RepID=A0A9P9H131_FUSSL|nr:uncharacterized protein B0J15DRAFT_563357 [Fusarium solani]KAH7247942.1 hypothetical protein B0J15DRAFT_563357 [Fusarium solani]KAJ3462040.1 hypothetical protein MRS44_010593 [Fusarium solani]
MKGKQNFLCGLLFRIGMRLSDEHCICYLRCDATLRSLYPLSWSSLSSLGLIAAPPDFLARHMAAAHQSTRRFLAPMDSNPIINKPPLLSHSHRRGPLALNWIPTISSSQRLPCFFPGSSSTPSPTPDPTERKPTRASPRDPGHLPRARIPIGLVDALVLFPTVSTRSAFSTTKAGATPSSAPAQSDDARDLHPARFCALCDSWDWSLVM